MEIEEDVIFRKSTTIVERKLSYDELAKSWNWSSPQTFSYKRRLRKEHIDIIRLLIDSDDLQTENVTFPPNSAERDTKNESNESIPESKFWKPPKLVVGEIYKVPSKNGRKWLEAKLIRINEENLLLVKVRSLQRVMVDLKFVAHMEPAGSFLKIGTRVLGLVNKISSTGEVYRGQRIHEMGIVMEIPNHENQYRYLIVLDDGWWAYVGISDIWPLCLQPEKPWQFLPDVTRPVVKDYLHGLFTKKVDYERGDGIHCVIDEKDIDHGIVLKVDASIVLFWSIRHSCAISTYRGLPHFRRTPEASLF